MLLHRYRRSLTLFFLEYPPDLTNLLSLAPRFVEWTRKSQIWTDNQDSN